MTKLFVICGHGAGDPGACGNGYQEAERVRALGKRIKELGGSNVTLGDVNRNYYADNGISKLTISKDYQIIELHMDSAAAAARGAHVIIKAGLNADQYDTALAKFMTGLFPGRSKTIAGRADLVNPARAHAKGYGYRLVECGFISNATDVSIFNNNIDKMAKGILGCFGIAVSGTTNASKPTTTSAPSTKPSTGTTKYSVGTPINTAILASSSDSKGQVHNKDHWSGTIGRVIAGARYPYRVDNGGVAIGWTDDAGIDTCPHVPEQGTSTAKPAAAKLTATTSKAKYKVGTKVCTNVLATSSTGGKVYKGDWSGTITRVISGAAYPYLLNNGTGWTNDKGIDSDPHVPK